ncbi:hydroxyacid-oxoacid transhydrogenase, mitochondrial-like [Dysidea avara]|uniref:hydroxyacid-oxoacid transhydrogenase, mitochondrial-like n=1 Tax=Dysidea avara TaxID=196820 RepID=UPI00331D916C
MASSREAVLRVMRAVSGISCACPAHSTAFGRASRRGWRHAHNQNSSDYAFEMASSNIRYGPGVTQEVGMDMVNLGLGKVAVFTDKNLAKLPPMLDVIASLEKHNVKYEVYSNVSIEPSDISFKDAIKFATDGRFDGILAVGGGSVMDTAKAANLYMCCPGNDFLDFVNAPIGRGLPITSTLKPLICIPTTAGTGSETTGVAIFDYKPLKAKTGIAGRSLRPLLGIVDPHHMQYMPQNVAIFSGFDVLCHALESYTAIPYNERTPRPENPKDRPAYQGSNPISDIWSKQALRIIAKYFKRSVFDAEDFEARSAMHLASVYAGIGFGNAGVHLCHGLSYPISGLVKSYHAKDYNPQKPLVPHGLSVVITAPAVFMFTASCCPDRHIEAAELLGADVTNVNRDDAGRVLADILRKYMNELMIPNGIEAFGYQREDVPALVEGTLPQQRVLKIAPQPPASEDIYKLLENSLKVY